MSGLRLVGRGAAFPSDLGLGADGPRALSGDDAWRLLLGDGWEAELERRGLERDRARERHGVTTREWLHRPGAAPVHDRGAERLATRAAERALDSAGLRGEHCDLVVVATSTPDRIGASLSARVAASVGASRASLDVRAGGAGGVLAWLVAARWLGAQGRSALVVAVESPSAYLHAEDPGNALLFGDAAGAIVLRRDDAGDAGCAAAVERTQPPTGTSFTVPGPLPPTSAALERGEYRLRPPDRAYRDRLGSAWRNLAVELKDRILELEPRSAELCANAATRALAEQVAEGLGLSPLPTLAALARHGACGSAACLVALAELDALPPRLVLAAVGGGVHAAGLVWDA